MATVKQGQLSADKSGVNKYNPNTGKLLSTGQTVTVKSSGGGGGSSAPAYNDATGATTGKPSAEYDAYLKSLNHPGSANYRPTPDDPGYENMDTVNNTAIKAGLPAPIVPAGTTATGALNDPRTQAMANLKALGYTNPDEGEIQGAMSSLGSKKTEATPFKQAFDQTKASGIGAPSSMGDAAGVVTSTADAFKQPDTSNIDLALSEDKGYQQLLKDQAEYNHVINQQKSLTETYDQLIKKAGIPALNTQLLNANKIIEGTEDDIRKEVQAVSGFATDSQVLALASARNKTLIQNYNNLLDTKKMAMESVNTMIGLAKEDQQTAKDNIIAKMGIDEKLMTYRDKFVNNAKEGYANVIKAIGYDGLYNSLVQSGDPSAISLTERSLGMPAGTLQAASIQSAKDRANQDSMTSLDIQAKKAQIANTYSEIGKRNYDMNATVGGVDEKTMGKIQSSPEYKTINGVLPAMTAVKAYLDAVNTSGSFEKFNGTNAGNLKATYGNAIAAWKTLAALGALSGADFGLAENVIPEPSLWTRNSKVKAQLKTGIDNAISQADIMTRRLSQNYPKAGDLLNQQLDEMKVTAYPDKFIMSPDGTVIEITD